MPKPTAPQLLGVGVALVLVGTVGGGVAQDRLLELATGSSWPSVAQAVASGLSLSGAALVGGAFVLAAAVDDARWLPRWTPAQLVAVGPVLAVLGVAASVGLFLSYPSGLWASPGLFVLLTDAASALVVLGATVVVGGLVLAAARRDRTRPVAPVATGDNPRPPSG